MVKAKAKQYGSYVQAWSCAFIQLYYNNHTNPEAMSSLSDKLRFCWCISGCTDSTSPPPGEWNTWNWSGHSQSMPSQWAALLPRCSVSSCRSEIVSFNPPAFHLQKTVWLESLKFAARMFLMCRPQPRSRSVSDCFQWHTQLPSCFLWLKQLSCF